MVKIPEVVRYRNSCYDEQFIKFKFSVTLIHRLDYITYMNHAFLKL